MKLILVCSAEADLDVDGGSREPAGLPLSVAGRAQAEALALHLQEDSIATIMSGPSLSARQTADALAAGRGLGVREEPGLGLDDSRYAEGVTSRQEDGAAAWEFIRSLGASGESEPILCVVDETLAHVLICRVLRLTTDCALRIRQDFSAITELDIRPDRIQIRRLNDTCHLTLLEAR